MCPNGIIVSLHGPYEGCRHDAGILRESQLYSHLEKLVGEGVFVLYGDPAYPLRPLLMKPYCGARISATQAEFNKSMSAVRQAVEWGFGKVVNEFAFVDLKKNQKLLLQDLAAQYRSAVILTNAHTCLYGSQTIDYFNVAPPSLEEYLNV